ncbi:hypothetical protein J2Z21_005353 [Streptomyces griseochromogenes]|uniref:Uncharacterized protein n=2 Tax=Streptomyces griseochromogenes TaxID=68214 RepID=A0ABS4LY83_9ACTN|nr:hypothetical protein [Streptomyces griseochromogenes]MBP2052370.1 hypothetical protein [Streptomyces griseochromogenes]
MSQLMRKPMARAGITVAAALGLALTSGVATAHAAAKPNTVDYFSSGGKKRAMVVFEPRDSARDDERVDVQDLSRDGHYIWTEVYDVTARKLKGHCKTSGFTSCPFAIPEGHQVRINVYRLNSHDSDFMGEVHTSKGKLPTA